ncbi:MAG: TonB-dependent receptor [Alphaproteobacteria bacterium]|nr:TonB-dependent receptor [Alphaproteobacteria bacterium]MBO6628631.1 TonB-dependent receptor [Alphaproteobacteria bacterium]MDF1626849.1 TonB-dependent receptor [Parvibaculaceae bacterium]
MASKQKCRARSAETIKQYQPKKTTLASKAALLRLTLLGTASIMGISVTTATAEEVRLNDLVVTSTGVGTERATHAGNITKLDKREIDIVGPAAPSEILNRAPGTFIQQGSGQEHLTAIRSPVLSGGAGAGSFLYLEDGVPFRAAGFANVNGLFDAVIETADSVEIVRGPGSALYGSNAVHGLVNILSETPSTTAQTRVRTWVGPHGSKQFNGTTTGGTGNHAARLSLVLNEDNGYRDDSGFGQQKAHLRYDYRAGNDYIRATFAAQNLNQETAGFVEGNDAYRVDGLRKSNPNPEAYRDAWSTRLAVRWEHDFSDGTTLAVTPYARLNRMNFLMHFLPGQPTETNGHWSSGVQTAYFMDLEGGHQIIVGADLEYTDGFLREFQTGPTTFGVFVQGLHYDYDVEAAVAAPFIHSVWSVSEDTKLTAGARLEYTRYDYTNNAPDNTVGRFQRTPDRVDEFFDVTPKLGITHAFDESLIGFANLARGARAPQTTDLYRLQNLQVPGEVESEETDSVEIGARGQTGGLTYEVATYYMEKSNFFFRDSAGLNAPNGETEHYGIEVEAAAPIGFGFDLAGSATYAVHKFTFNRPAAAASNSIRSGDDIDTAPRTLASLRLGRDFWNDRLRAELEWVHVGDYAADPGQTSIYEGHDLLNLRARFTVNEGFDLYGRVTNLTDERYADRADIIVRGGTATERYFPGEERALFIGAGFRF